MTAVQTVKKTIAVLEALIEIGVTPVSVSDLADHLGWSRAATHQYLSSLLSVGWLQQDSDRRYRLASQAAFFGRYALETAGVPRIISSVMQRLVDELTEPVFFATHNGEHAVIMESCLPKRSFAIYPNFARHMDMKASASGRVLLAFDDKTSSFDKTDLETELRVIRQQGYAHVNVLWVGDMIDAIAIPIFQRNNCLGALSVIAPEGRMDLAQAITTLREARRHIEGSLNSGERVV